MRFSLALDNEHQIRNEKNSKIDFLQFCLKVAEHIDYSIDRVPEIVNALTKPQRPSVIYLHNAECTGCSEALLRSSSPNIDQILFDYISLDYHETIMASSGEIAEELLEKSIDNPYGFICIVEGAIPTANQNIFGTVGGKTMYDNCLRILPKAKALIAIGTCAAYGGIQSAEPNITEAKGIGDIFPNLHIPIINLAGCPPNPLNLVGALVLLMLDKQIELDKVGRPKIFYGKTVHQLCERLPHFQAKNFATSFNSEEAKKGYCLLKLGCKGPKTFNNCPTALFNSVNWPIKAGHPCIGCSEPNFWDKLTPFYAKKPKK